MKKRIDFKFLGISGAIVVIAVASAWAAIVLFRDLFPLLAAETFWDELTGPTIAALVIIGIKSILLREQTFHLLVKTDIPGLSTVNLYMLRRRKGLGLVFMPTFQREAIINDRDTLVRNVSWWGVNFVDLCTLCFYFGNDETNCHYVKVPGALNRAHGTFRVRLSELSDSQPLVVSQQHVE